MRLRQILAAVLLLIVVMVILYPTTATGTVNLSAQYEQAVVEAEPPVGRLVFKGITNIYVSFSEVRIHSANEENETGWLPISFGTPSIDLVDLKNEFGTILVTPTVPVGEYNGVMLVFSNVTAVFNGTTAQVESVPAYTVVGHRFNVRSGLETNLRLKFTVDYRALNSSRRVFFEVNPIID
ncbi:MAG: DUF4382 domain-containing protein [Candidatus Bathyarchaeia archaeon]